jgi:hypothetical protein
VLSEEELAELPGREVLLLVNGDAPVEMTGWTLEDLDGNLFTFPEFTFAPNAWLRIWTLAAAEEEGDLESTTDLFWGLEAETLWQMESDTATLRNTLGEEISTCTWTAAEVEGGLMTCPVETLPELETDE